jgi:hypothetical protein
MHPVRCLQTVTAAAVLFAIVGACGLTPLSRGPRVRARPPLRRSEVTIRSLTGTWEAVVQGAGGPETLTLTLLQRGDAISGTLTARGSTLPSDTASPAHLDARGQFTLGFGQSHERVWIHGRPDVSGDQIAGWVTGATRESVMATFVRR